MVLYHNKNIPWKWISARKVYFEKPHFFYFHRVPNNKNLISPRFHTFMNLFFVSFWRDNSNIKFGIGFGKRHYQITFHH